MSEQKRIYLIGSLRNEQVPIIAKQIREQTDHYVFDEWYSAGHIADDCWQAHQTFKGHDYRTALRGEAAQHVFQFDKKFLDLSDTAILLMPAGKSGHLEFGYCIGRGMDGYILFDKEPDRFDVMTNFANDIYFHTQDLIERLKDG